MVSYVFRYRTTIKNYRLGYESLWSVDTYFSEVCYIFLCTHSSMT